jgi:hypothetical protein
MAVLSPKQSNLKRERDESHNYLGPKPIMAGLLPKQSNLKREKRESQLLRIQNKNGRAIA